MPETPPHTIPEFSEVKEYQDALLQALNVAHSYDGTGSSYEKVTEELISFEEKIRSFNLVPEGSIQDHEIRAFERFLRRDHGTVTPNISTLFDIASASEGVNRAIRASLVAGQSTHQESAPELPLFVRRITGVILPPDPDHLIPRQGEGAWEPARFQERLLELTKLLERGEVFLDDYIVTIGTLLPSQMREMSYAVVEIPRINRTVLVCDQIGEATFVIYGIGDPRRFLSLTKDELLESLGASIKRVVRSSDQQWHSDLGSFLFTEDAWSAEQQRPRENQGEQQKGKRVKLDVRRMVEVRDAIFESEYNTPEKWVKIDQRQATVFNLPSLGGIHLNAMSRPFGIEGNPISSTALRLELGRRIFGNDPIIMEAIENQTITIEKIRAAFFQSDFNTAEKYVNMNARQAGAFHLTSLGGLGFTAIGFYCGIEGAPISNTLVRLKIGKIIFEDDPIIIQAIENKGITMEKIRVAVSQGDFNTPTKWVKMTQKEASAFKLQTLGGMSLGKIAKILGVKGVPTGYKLSQLEIGREIFNNDPEILQAIDGLIAKQEGLKDVTPEKVIQEILASKYGTSSAWVAMTSKEATDFKLPALGGIRMKAIASNLGFIGGDPSGEYIARLELGRRIFGDDTIIMRAIELENLTSEQIKQAVFGSQFNTEEKWVNMTSEQARTLKLESLGGIGINAIARICGVEGDPQIYRYIRLELAQELFGDSPVLREEIAEELERHQGREQARIRETPESLRIREQMRNIILQSEFNTPEKWIRMKAEEALAFKIIVPSDRSYGLSAIARKFGLLGNPTFSKLLRLELGRKIFGDNPKIMEAIEWEYITSEKVRDAVLHSEHNTPEKMLNMTSAQLHAFKLPSLGGIGLVAMAGYFGMKMKDVKDKNALQEFCRNIFGNQAVDRALIEKK